MAIRTNFPPPGADYLGGECNGWEYKTTFSGGKLEQSYAMIKQFLEEEGYEDVPIPQNAEQLLLFKQKEKQLSIFDEIGYIHNPIKILFNLNERTPKSLTLCLYNEEYPDHLLRFHKVFKG